MSGSPFVTKDVRFFVLDGATGARSFTWRLWSHRLSFYGQLREPRFAQAKFSFHGGRQDPPSLHRGEPHYEFSLSGGSPKEKADSSGGVVINGEQRYASTKIKGFRANLPGVDMVVRIRFPWHVFRSPSPDERVDDSASVLSLPAPRPGHATDIDLYVSHPDAYWPAASHLTPFALLQNDAGQYLTAVAMENYIEDERAEVTDEPIERPPADVGRPGTLRGFSLLADERGFVWVVDAAEAGA